METGNESIWAGLEEYRMNEVLCSFAALSQYCHSQMMVAEFSAGLTSFVLFE